MPARAAKRRTTRRKSPPASKARERSSGPVSLAEAKRIALAKTGPAPLAKKVAADTSVQKLAAERRQLSRRTRADLQERIRLYDATYRVMRQRGVKGVSATQKKGPGAKAAATPLRVFAEGDSWFDYPVPFFGGGLISRLEQRLGLPILNAAEAGDEVRFMLGVKQRAKLTALLQRAVDRGEPWDVLLFSGGGNDIVGDPLCLWIREFAAGTPPEQLIEIPRFDAALGFVRAGYEDLIAIRDRVSPRTRLVFHAYDFAIPSGRGICHLGPWLRPSFDLRGFPDVTDGAAVVRVMLKRFAKLLAGLEAAHADVTFIDAQGTLDAHADWWHNELHPNAKGFDEFVAVFDQRLRQLYPGRIP